MTEEITLTKGAYSVEVHAEKITDSYEKKIFFIRPGTSTQQQSDGPKETRCVDLLIITHSFVVKGWITGTSTKTALEVKNDLATIIKGAGISAGPTTLSYAGTDYSVYIEKSYVTESSQDEPASIGEEIAKYEISLTLIEGTKI